MEPYHDQEAACIRDRRRRFGGGKHVHSQLKTAAMPAAADHHRAKRSPKD
jgi:hypothetical protein